VPVARHETRRVRAREAKRCQHASSAKVCTMARQRCNAYRESNEIFFYVKEVERGRERLLARGRRVEA